MATDSQILAGYLQAAPATATIADAERVLGWNFDRYLDALVGLPRAVRMAR